MAFYWNNSVRERISAFYLFINTGYSSKSRIYWFYFTISFFTRKKKNANFQLEDRKIPKNSRLRYKIYQSTTPAEEDI